MRRISILLLLLLATTASAQVSKLTWIRHYQAYPGKEDLLTQQLIESLAKVRADGIATWGIAVPLSHNDQPWTHMVFAGVRDWAAIESLADTLVADAKRSVLTVPDGTRDTVIVHVVRSTTASTVKPKYLVINEHP